MLGAAGGVGTAALQIAKAAGARVIAGVSSQRKVELCLSLGADAAINYSSENLREALKAITGGKGPDVIYDPVGGDLAEPSFRSLWWRELRWARAIRAMQPLGFALSFVTYAVPLALLCLFALAFRPASWLILAAAVGLRVAAHHAARQALGVVAGRVWAAPIRDVLSFAVWASSFFGRKVRWRGHEMVVERGGRLRAGRPETRRDGGDGHGRPVAAG